ncbi:MAG TPA: hypothetical protein VF607_03425, partial [Verrucomicrobiae bacterium]
MEFRIYNRILAPAEVLNDFVVGPGFAGDTLKWNGNFNAVWDFNSTSNWLAGNLPVNFVNGAKVWFDDTLVGNTNITITNVVSPALVTVSNVLRTYTFGGSSGIGGGGSLLKAGSGTFYLNGNHPLTGGVLVNGGTLAGVGTLAAPVTVAGGATLAPGTVAMGTMVINNQLSLAAGSRTAIRFSLDGGVTNMDRINGLTAVTYGGDLVVTNVGSTVAISGAQLRLFNAVSPGTGNFNSVTILPAGSGAFDPATGMLTIAPVPAPSLNPVVVTGGNLVFTGNGGWPGTTYSILTATNLATPLPLWITNSSGVFDGAGNFSNGIPLDASQPAVYYRIKIP